MRTIILTLLGIIIFSATLIFIGKIIGDIPHMIDFKKDATHRDEED